MKLKTIVKATLPLIILALGVLAFLALVKSRKSPPRAARPNLGVLVRTAGVKVSDLPMSVRAQGTVRPGVEIEITPQVAGRVVEVSPFMVNGGFFEAGDLLLRIDQRDYELAVARAEADVARMDFELLRAEEEGEIARREFEIVSGDGSSMERPDEDSLLFHGPQLKLARANLDAARARLDEARLALERTVIVAPFDGRVRKENVDVGQYVSPGRSVATIYGIDAAEIVLPVPDEDLAWFDLPRRAPGRNSLQGTAERGSKVRIKARFAGREHEWTGRIVRTEGTIDTASRMVQVVVRVDEPYSVGAGGRHRAEVPLAVGMFVEGIVEGPRMRNVSLIPRHALRENSTVWVAGEEGLLRVKPVTVSRLTNSEAMITSGLSEDDRIVLSRIDAVTDGMKIRTQAVKGGEASLLAERDGLKAEVH